MKLKDQAKGIVLSATVVLQESGVMERFDVESDMVIGMLFEDHSVGMEDTSPENVIQPL